MKRANVQATWRAATVLALVVILVGCNEEKAVAVKTLATQLLDASSRIDKSLHDYWAVYRPATGANQEQEQYRNLALFLVAQHGEIQEGSDPQAYHDAMRRMLDAVRETRRASSPPGLPQIRDAQRRAAAVKQAVAGLEEGSYFAGRAIERLEERLLLIAGDLKRLHDLIREQDQVVDEVRVEGGAYFDRAFANILRRASAPAPLPVEVLAQVIEDEIEKGFQMRRSRIEARDELLGRIAVTAGLAVTLADKVKDYRKVRWSELMGYARDLAALASDLELPESYVVGANEALRKVERRWEQIEKIRERLGIEAS